MSSHMAAWQINFCVSSENSTESEVQAGDSLSLFISPTDAIIAWQIAIHLYDFLLFDSYTLS